MQDSPKSLIEYLLQKAEQDKQAEQERRRKILARKKASRRFIDKARALVDSTK